MSIIHNIPAGTLPNDFRTEIIGIRETRQAFFIKNGQTLHISELPKDQKKVFIHEIINDPEAMRDLRGKGMTLSQAIEEYAFCMYGAVDSTGDIDQNGKLQPSENFRCSGSCRCIRWSGKMINIYGRPITPREIQVLDSMRSDDIDELRASKLGMTRSTLNTHKKNLFEKFGVASSSALIAKAITHKIIQ